ncbi:hypothetical protein IJG22_00930 [Candidatus Saccharibacteria bacterium]|nr:hypothetical protein [Candidatus Saccharibacteria bacterium]
MDNNPGETPNPLNPSPVGGSEANDTNVTPATPVAQSTVDSADTTSVTPAAEPVAPTTAPVASLDPTGRTMEKTVEVPEPPKKSKAGLIAAIVIGCVLLIGGIVTAILFAMNSGPDNTVAMAMQKIMNGEASKNVAIDGDINILINDESTPIQRINIDLDSDIVIGSMINTSSAVITLTDRDSKDYSARFEEIYAADNNLFFKLEGTTAALEDSGLIDLLNGNSSKTNCVIDENNATNCETPLFEEDCADESLDCATQYGSTEAIKDMGALLTNTIVSMIEAADGLYLRISSEDMATMGAGAANSSQLTCIADLVEKADKNSNSTALLYNKYPFIISSSENIPVSKKQNPIYQVMVDSANFTNFVNEMQNTELANSLFSCLGWNNHASINEEDVEEIVSSLPKVYAEVNADYNFTRLYLESDISDGKASVTIDLGFSYPSSVTVSEPVEYTDFKDFLETLFESMYNTKSSTAPQAN